MVSGSALARSDEYFESLEPPYTTLSSEVDKDISPVAEKPVDAEISENSIETAADGRIGINLAGSLDGSGTFGMNSMPGLEAKWTAPKDATYVLRSEYQLTGEYDQQAFGESTDAVMSLEPTLAVLPQDDRVLASKSVVNLEVGAETTGDPALQLLLNFLAKRLVFPHLGFLGKIIGHVVLHLIPSWGPDNSGDFRTFWGNPYTGSIRSMFQADEGSEYRFQLITSGGFSGTAEENDGGFSSELEANYKLTDITIEEEPVPFGWGTSWWEQKLGAEDINSYEFARWGEDYWEDKLETDN